MYEALGFTKNPFFTEPLEPSKESLEKFVGRREDVHSYLAQIAGQEGCVHLVTGNPGVGKTTFVNVMQYVTSFDDPKTCFKDITHCPTLLIPNTKKLQINSDETAQSLMLKITSSIIYSLVHIYEKKEQRLPQEVEKQHKWINELIVSVGKPTGGAQAFGFGASGGGGSISQAVPTSASISHLAQIDRQILESALPDLGMNGIYVIVNNLDIVDLNVLVQILNELRDELFSIKSLWITLLD
ncbi:MAG: ATP-binding protein [Pseudomonadota bacterium]